MSKVVKKKNPPKTTAVKSKTKKVTKKQKKKNKKKLIIILSILLGVATIGAIAFFVVTSIIKEKERQEFISNVKKYEVVYNKALLGHSDINLILNLWDVTDGYNKVKDDTILYWSDYIDNQVYGYSTYGMKTWSDVDDKVYSLNADTFEKNYTIRPRLLELSKKIENAEVEDKNAKAYQEALIAVYDSYDELYSSIFAFNTSFNGFNGSVGTAITNYNKAMEDVEYYSGKYANKYLTEYEEFVEKVGFEQYCSAWQTEKEDYSYTNFQNCAETINEELGIE